jgi:hypothetical protein
METNNEEERWNKINVTIQIPHHTQNSVFFVEKKREKIIN